MVRVVRPSLTFYTSFRCNLHCPLCLQAAGSNTGPHYQLKLKDAHDWCESFRTAGVYFKAIDLTGGEPCLYDNLPNLITLIRDVAITDKIRVVTNGTRNPTCLREADEIHVTDYGAINHWHIYKLRQMYGNRVKVSPSLHVPVPVPYSQAIECHSVIPKIVGRTCYPCCTMAHNAREGISLDYGTTVKTILHADPRGHELCHRCASNKRAYLQIVPPPTIQISVWGSKFSWMRSFRNAKKSLIYRAYARWKSRR